MVVCGPTHSQATALVHAHLATDSFGSGSPEFGLIGAPAAKEADDGVPGSQRAERPEFEGTHEGRGAGKRGVPTFHCTLPRLAASSMLSMRTDFLVGTILSRDRLSGFTDYKARLYHFLLPEFLCFMQAVQNTLRRYSSHLR